MSLMTTYQIIHVISFTAHWMKNVTDLIRSLKNWPIYSSYVGRFFLGNHFSYFASLREGLCCIPCKGVNALLIIFSLSKYYVAVWLLSCKAKKSILTFFTIVVANFFFCFLNFSKIGTTFKLPSSHNDMILWRNYKCACTLSLSFSLYLFLTRLFFSLFYFSFPSSWRFQNPEEFSYMANVEKRVRRRSAIRLHRSTGGTTGGVCLRDRSNEEKEKREVILYSTDADAPG